MTEILEQEPEKKLLETACDRERVAIIFNPASGTLDCDTRRSTLEGLSREVGLTCGLEETDKEQGARPLAHKAVSDGMERLLVSGGDGSVTEAADVLTGTNVALAVLPGGTGNLLALNLGIPTDCQEAMRVALTEEARPIDVGRANGHVFVILAGMGADAQMIRDANREAKKRLGVIAYFLAAFRSIGRRRVLYTIMMDDRRIQRRAKTVMVANVGRITAGLDLVPGADPTDGILEVVILRARNLGDVVKLAMRVLLGRNRSDNLMEIHHARHIVIETGRPQPVELDGNEAGTASRLEVEVEPAGLKLVRPAPSEEEAPTLSAVLADAAGFPLWIPILAGIGTMMLVHRVRSPLSRWKAASLPSGEKEADHIQRFAPLLAGLAVGVIAAVLVRRARTRQDLTRRNG